MAPDTLFTRDELKEKIALAETITSINDRLGSLEKTNVKILDNLEASNKACTSHRKTFQDDLQQQKDRLNKVYTVFGVVIFLFGVAVKMRWI